MKQYLTRFKTPSFQVRSHAPSTVKALHESKLATLCVWSGASDGTIWGDPQSNYAFRAWHDARHLESGLDFTTQGEIELARLQAAEAGRIIGDRFAALVYAEIAGQAEYFEAFGAFPTDQRAFIEAYLSQGAKIIGAGLRF